MTQYRPWHGQHTHGQHTREKHTRTQNVNGIQRYSILSSTNTRPGLNPSGQAVASTVCTHILFQSIKDFQFLHGKHLLLLLYCAWGWWPPQPLSITLKAVKEELNKIYATELSGKLYPVEESFFIELETRQYSRRMAVLAQRLNSATAEKLLKTLKGSRGSGQSTQTAPRCPLTFPSAKQTLQRYRLLRLMLFSFIHGTREVVAKKYCNCMNCVASPIIVLVCGSYVHHD